MAHFHTWRASLLQYYLYIETLIMFKISTPGEADADRIATIHLAAMQPNALLHVQFPTQESLKSLHRFLVQDTLMHLNSLDKGVLVARDGALGDITGFVKWEVPSNAAGKVQQEEELDWPEDCCREWIDKYYEQAEKAERDAIGEMRCCRGFSFLRFLDLC
jgi:hypothetical protein